VISCFFLTQVDKLLNTPRTYTDKNVCDLHASHMLVPVHTFCLNSLTIVISLVAVSLWLFPFGFVNVGNVEKRLTRCTISPYNQAV
jgi:uncharacterized membrane protein